MSLFTAAPTRVPGLVLVVVLGAGSALVPASALGTPGGADPVGVWPLRPRPEVVAGFDPPLDAWGSGHRGVDLRGSAGQAVRAALPGRVTYAGMLAGRGVVVVSHGDTRTTYEPVSAEVSVGAAVTAGDRLGRLTTLGSHCFPVSCLHWGWLRGDIYLDPLDLVGDGPIRLLPLWRDGPWGVDPSRDDPVLDRPRVAAQVPRNWLPPTRSPWPPTLLRLLNTVGLGRGGVPDGADSTP